MKKILSVMLLLCCLFTVCSCSFIQDKLGIGGSATGIKAFENAIKECNASSVEVAITSEDTSEENLGTLNSSIKVVYNQDGSAVITYVKEEWNDALSASEELKTATTYIFNRAADGTYTGDVPEGVDLPSVTAAPAINFDTVKSSVEINDASDVLNVTVPAANTAAVFGFEFSKDVNLEVSLKDGALFKVKLTFEGGSISSTYA